MTPVLGFLARRVAATVGVLGVVAVLVFLLLRLVPGDPAAIIAGDSATIEQIDQIRDGLGLNRPLPVQFGIWFSNVSIKSGTNTFSGSVFDHFGHDVLNAKSYFQQEKTPYKQHEGGFTFGGPIKKDKTFFFSSLGVFYSRVGQGAAVITVPTDAFKAGDFSALGVPIYDPATTRPR